MPQPNERQPRGAPTILTVVAGATTGGLGATLVWASSVPGGNLWQWLLPLPLLPVGRCWAMLLALLGGRGMRSPRGRRAWRLGSALLALAVTATVIWASQTALPLEARVRIGRPAMDRAATRLSQHPELASSARRLGLFHVDGVAVEQGTVRFYVAGASSFVDPCGLAWHPGPLSAGNVDYFHHHLSGPWYSWCGS